MWRHLAFRLQTAPDPALPNERPSVGDYDVLPENINSTPPLELEDFDAAELSHTPPGPCYAGLTNNVSTPLMQTTLGAWPPETPDFVSQKVIEEYIQHISVMNGVVAVTKYNTRVENVQKHDEVWKLRTISLDKPPSGPCLYEHNFYFGAVVVASGHYNVPRIPDTPGLSKWKALWPDRVQHSKSYRNPEKFQGKTILLIGAGVSSCDIAKESSRHAKHIYQSSRGGALDLPASFLPTDATRIGAIRSFDVGPNVKPQAGARASIPASIILLDGRKICGIDHVILCTGYMTSYLFLRHLHSDSILGHEVDDKILVTAEGDMIHNLHKDIFYIPNPSLAIFGAPYHIATFSLFEFQAQAVARVFAGKAKLAPPRAMRDEYNLRVARKGLGREFHSLRGQGEEQAYVADLVTFMNEDAIAFGVEQIAGHTEKWHEANAAREEKLKWLRGSKNKEAEIGKYDGEADLIDLC